MRIKDNENKIKKQLKAEKPKTRKGTRSSNVSLDRKQYTISTVAFFVCNALRHKEKNVAETTFAGMKTHARHIIRSIGEIDMKVLTTDDIEELKLDLQDQGKQGKVINGCYTILRDICNKAVDSGFRETNPMKNIENVKLCGTDNDSLTEEEFQRLLAQATEYIMSKYMLICGALLATRISELACLSWERTKFITDEDGIERAHVTIDLAKPLNQYKLPKTETSKRTVKASPECTAILKEMKKLTGHLSPIEIDVVQNDNYTVKKEKRSFIFYNDQTGQPWLNPKQYAKQFFKPFLKEAGVRHRGPNQLRHTGASLHYANGVSLAWIASLLGHTSTHIVEKHYATLKDERAISRDQSKADDNIRRLFETSDENSIVVPRAQQESESETLSNQIAVLVSLARKAETETEREAIFNMMAQLSGGKNAA